MNHERITLAIAGLSLGALALTGCSAGSDASGAPQSSASTAVDGAAAPASQAASSEAFDGHITNNSLAVSPDEKTAVVSDSRQDTILVYDLAAGGLRKKISGFGTPRNIVFVDGGSRFVVSDSTLGTLRLYDTEDLALQDEIVVGPGAFGTAVSPDGKSLYVNNEAHDSVTVVDLKTGKPTDVMTGFSEPRQGIKVSPNGELVLVTNFKGDKVTVIDAASRKIVGNLEGFSKIRGISVSGDGNTLYAANSGRNTISVVDLKKGTTSNEIKVGTEPYGAALSPDGTLLFASNKADDTIDVIDTDSQSVVKTLKGFAEPRQAIVFNKGQSRAYVLNKDLSIARVDVQQLTVSDTLRQ